MSRQYIAAGRIVDEVLNGRRSFKSVAHSNNYAAGSTGTTVLSLLLYSVMMLLDIG